MSAEGCARSGCSGVLEDGYCSLCGLAARKAPAAPVPTANSAASAGKAPFSAAARENLPRAGAVPRPVSVATRASRDSSKIFFHGGALVRHEPDRVPEMAVLQDPQVPEHKRCCSRCEARVRREAGFCGRCGARYNFAPTLRAGDCVANQYEVRGPIAFGGLGWIYLAFDRLLSRYVVLKGLLNAQDEEAATAALAERQFLAAVKHPNIVAIYNFVEVHGEGFIVMEYIRGLTLKQIRLEGGPVPPAEAVAWIHRALGALAYLHGQGLAFCDFKPDNLMLEEDEIKLIDLGGVRRIGDHQTDMYGTVGYSAPEAGEGPTAAADLFTVGRTLAVLLAEIEGFTQQQRFTLPNPDQIEVFRQEESLYRLVSKATAQQPQDRFRSAAEMAEQLSGVYREIVARATGVPQRGVSSAFGADLLTFQPGDPLEEMRPSPHLLPRLARDESDTSIQAVEGALSVSDPAKRFAALRTIRQQDPASREAALRLAGMLIDAGGLEEAQFLLDEVSRENVNDWRPTWYRGMLALRRSDANAACDAFDAVRSALPGELAPKLAVALAAELSNDLDQASRLYALVAEVDPTFVSALFGLARCAQRQGDREASAQALSRIEGSSALFVRGRIAAVRALLSPNPRPPERRGVLAAASMLETLPLDDHDRALLSEEVLRAALAVCGGAQRKEATATVLGIPLEERALRLALERVLRKRSTMVGERERMCLLDAANQVRPRSLL